MKAPLRTIFAAAALTLAVPFASSVAGCSKKDEATADKSDKDKGGKSSGKKKGGYGRGDLLSHVPKSCKKARIYVDVAGLLGSEAILTSADALEEKLADLGKSSGDKKAKKALSALKKAGLDPTHDVKDVAICAGKDTRDVTVAIGGDFAGKDPLDALAKAAEAAGDDEPKVKEADGVKYLKAGKAFVGLVAPNVLVFTEDKDTFGDLAKGEDQSSAWGLGKNRLVVFKGNDAKAGEFEGSIEEKGSDLVARLSLDVKGLGGKASPSKVKTELEGAAEHLSKKLKGPFKKLGDAVAETKFDVDGDTVTIKLTVPSADLADVLKKLAAMDEKDLKESVEL